MHISSSGASGWLQHVLVLRKKDMFYCSRVAFWVVWLSESTYPLHHWLCASAQPTSATQQYITMPHMHTHVCCVTCPKCVLSCHVDRVTYVWQSPCARAAATKMSCQDAIFNTGLFQLLSTNQHSGNSGNPLDRSKPNQFRVSLPLGGKLKHHWVMPVRDTPGWLCVV